MKILVTGGTGFVGPRIVHALRTANRDVRVLARRPEQAAHVGGWGAEVVQGDVTAPATLTAAVDGCTHVGLGGTEQFGHDDQVRARGEGVVRE